MPRMQQERKCAHCGVLFVAHHPSAKYCSESHRIAAHLKRKRAEREKQRLSDASKKALRYLEDRCPQAAAKVDRDFIADLGAECTEAVLKFALIVLAEVQAGSAA